MEQKQNDGTDGANGNNGNGKKAVPTTASGLPIHGITGYSSTNISLFFKKALITTGIIVIAGGITWLGYKGFKSTSNFFNKINNVDKNVSIILQNSNSTANGVNTANSKLDDITPIIKDIKSRVVSIDKKSGEVTIHLDRNEMAQLEVTVVEEKKPSMISRIWPFGKSKTKKVEKKVNNISYKVTTNETVKAVPPAKPAVAAVKPVVIEPKKKEGIKITPPKAKEVKIIKPKARPKTKEELKKEAEKKKQDEAKIRAEVEDMVKQDHMLK